MSYEQAQVASQVGSAAAGEVAVAMDPHKLQRYMEKLRADQNLLKGVAGGFAGAAMGAVLWAVITVLTEYQIGYMALGVGFLAGLGVRLLGKGVDPAFRIAGAGLALAGCLAGNLMAVLIFGSIETGLPLTTILGRLTPSIVVELYTATFSAMDLLFYGLAVSIGYRTALVTIPREEMEKLV